MLIYDKLCDIADAHPTHLTSYRGDLHQHDRHELAKGPRSERYIWILREHGTELFPIGYGFDPVWVTYWIDARNYIVPPLAYEIDLKAGSVREISYDRARHLAAIPSSSGRAIRVNLAA